MASPTRALRTGINTLLANVTYTKKKTGASGVPYIESRPFAPHKIFPVIRYKDCLLSPSDAKVCRGWECVVTLEVISSTQPGRGDFDPVDEIESTIISLMTDMPYTLSVSGFSIVSIQLEDSSYDESLRVIDRTDPNAKPQRVISKDVDFLIFLSES